MADGSFDERRSRRGPFEWRIGNRPAHQHPQSVQGRQRKDSHHHQRFIARYRRRTSNTTILILFILFSFYFYCDGFLLYEDYALFLFLKLFRISFRLKVCRFFSIVGEDSHAGLRNYETNLINRAFISCLSDFR